MTRKTADRSVPGSFVLRGTDSSATSVSPTVQPALQLNWAEEQIVDRMTPPAVRRNIETHIERIFGGGLNATE